MIIRDVNGLINIVCRKDFENDTSYYEKIYKIKVEYIKKYKSIIINNPKVSQINNNNK